MSGSNRYGVLLLLAAHRRLLRVLLAAATSRRSSRDRLKVVIVEGAADSPVYLEISERGVAIHPADDVWGLDTYAGGGGARARTAGVPKAQACVIGPAGENLVRFACIENNKWRSLGRGGPGAVLGSKKVKGIVFHGDRKVEVARPEAFKALVKDMAARAKDDPGVAAYRRGARSRWCAR